MSFVVVDTDVASTILKGSLREDLAGQLAGQQLAITFVTVGELTQWTFLHQWGPRRRAGLRAFFASIVVLPCSYRAATLWGEIQAHARLRGRPRPITTAGSPLAASRATFRSPPSTRRISATSLSTRG